MTCYFVRRAQASEKLLRYFLGWSATDVARHRSGTAANSNARERLRGAEDAATLSYLTAQNQLDFAFYAQALKLNECMNEDVERDAAEGFPVFKNFTGGRTPWLP